MTSWAPADSPAPTEGASPAESGGEVSDRATPTQSPAATSPPSAFGLRVDKGPDALAEEPGLPPVVARMVVEIRSDGTRTIARGALEDRVTGERVALRADAASPVALAQQLTGALLKTPTLAKQTLSGLVPEAIKRRLPFGRR